MTLKNLYGRVSLILPEDDFDVDQIVGIDNIKIQDPAQLAALALRWCGEDFARRHRPGDLIVAGRNFGYGHPHYPTMIGMRHLGVAGVIGEYFSPGYWRGEIANGFPQVACSGILGFVRLWDDLEVDWTSAHVLNLSQGTQIPFEALARSEMAMLESGGLLAFLTQTLGNQRCE